MRLYESRASSWNLGKDLWLKAGLSVLTCGCLWNSGVSAQNEADDDIYSLEGHYSR